MLNMVSFCNSDNILVLDIFFEALNYETIEQKKAYEVAGLLGISMMMEKKHGFSFKGHFVGNVLSFGEVYYL